MDIDIGSLRCMAPSLGIPPHRHYDPSDLQDAGLRLGWAKFLFRAGYRLRYPQETTGTAILLFHRFLIQERVGKHQKSRDVILTTCLFLAGKVTEAPRRLRDVINVLHMLTRTSQDEPPLLDKAYWTMKERIVEFEQVLLRTINFQVDPPDPYRLLLNYARSLRLGRAATRTAWGLVNDALFCPRALSAPPPAVACAAIRMATRIHGSERRLRWFSPPRHKSGGGDNKRQRESTRDGDVIDTSGVSGAGNDDSGGEGVRHGLVISSGGGGGTPSANNDGASGGGGGGSGGGGGARKLAGPENSATARVETAGVNTTMLSKQEPKEVRDGGGGASSANGADSSTNRGLGIAGAVVGAASSPPSGAVINLTGSARAGSAGEIRDNDDNRHAAAENTTMPWWVLFDARDEEVELVCSELLALYHDQGGGVDDGRVAAASLVVLLSSQSESVVGDGGPSEAAAVDVAGSNGSGIGGGGGSSSSGVA